MCPKRFSTASLRFLYARKARVLRVLCRPRLPMLLWLLAALSGCGLFGPYQAPEPLPAPAPKVSPAPAYRAPDDSALLRGQLYAHYRLWAGTPYRLGGLTTRGIDCSGFVLVTFKALLDTRLPRTVDEQAALGRGIVPAELQSGDLVFFRTAATLHHVGIYLDHGRFMHASTRRGVIISGLTDDYWRQRFWQARRIYEPQADDSAALYSESEPGRATLEGTLDKGSRGRASPRPRIEVAN